MTYTNKVEDALVSCKLIKEVQEIQEAIQVTSQINRRTKQGREDTEKLLGMCHDKINQLANHGENPF